MTESTFQLASIRGIRIGIHVTWLFVFGLVTWSLAEGHGLFQTMFPEWSVTDRWGVAVVGSILLFGSVLVHELAHAVVAQKRGMRVQSITLFIFGGVANIKDEARSPMDEFLVAIVGPIASFALALFFFLLSGVGESLGPLFGACLVPIQGKSDIGPIQSDPGLSVGRWTGFAGDFVGVDQRCP